MNKVTLVGRIGRDAELKQIGDNVNITFSLATSEKYSKNGEKKEVTEWHNITAWGDKWRNVAPFLTKGKQVAIDGRIHYRESVSGECKRYFTDIEMQHLELLSGGDAKRQEVPPLPKASADDLTRIFSCDGPAFLF